MELKKLTKLSIKGILVLYSTTACYETHSLCKRNEKLFLKRHLPYVYNALQKYTDCPATLSTLSEGYYSGVGGPTGQVVVHSGRGRFDIFFKVSWTHLR